MLNEICQGTMNLITGCLDIVTFFVTILQRQKKRNIWRKLSGFTFCQQQLAHDLLEMSNLLAANFAQRKSVFCCRENHLSSKCKCKLISFELLQIIWTSHAQLISRLSLILFGGLFSIGQTLVQHMSIWEYRHLLPPSCSANTCSLLRVANCVPFATDNCNSWA